MRECMSHTRARDKGSDYLAECTHFNHICSAGIYTRALARLQRVIKPPAAASRKRERER